MPLVAVPFTNIQQQKTFWCWAAVATNCFNSMLPATAPAKTQCDVVTLVQGNCTGNAPDALSSALFDLGIHDRLAAAPKFSIPVTEISGLDGLTEPVCAEIVFPGNAIHFVAISSVDTDNSHVWIDDPYLGGNAVEFAYNDFIHNYHYSNAPEIGSGTVQNFQRVEKPSPSAG